MNPLEEQNARAITQITRWTLVMLQNAEQGHISVKVLERTVDPSVLAALGPITPPRPDQPRQPPRVGRIRVHLVTDEFAHVAAVAGRPDGRPAGFVLEFRCEAHRRDWHVTELSRAEERRLIIPEARHALSRRDTKKLPADLSAVIRSTEHARAQAQAAMDTAAARAKDLRDQIAQCKARGGLRTRERISLSEQERIAHVEAARWQRRLTDITTELRELNDVAELREARRLVTDGDPLMKVRKPEHLVQLLGPIPEDRAERAAWRGAASTIERYRQTWSIDDSVDALGALPPDATPEQQEHHRETLFAVAIYQAPRETNIDNRTVESPELELGR